MAHELGPIRAASGLTPQTASRTFRIAIFDSANTDAQGTCTITDSA